MYCVNCGCKLELEAKFCTHCGAKTAMANSDNIGKIIVTRKNMMWGFAIPFNVYVDDNKLGTLTNGKTLSCTASLCSHRIVLKSTEDDVVVDIDLSTNKKEVTLIIIPKMGLIAARPYVEEIKYN